MGKFLSELKPPRGAVQNKKRLGRGDGSGHGGTSTKGHKGQRARAGGYHKVGFEGGQMPLARRLPKRGFTNIFKTRYSVINLKDLEGIPSGTKVDVSFLKENRLIKKIRGDLKILGQGEIKVPLTIIAAKVSESAREKIEKAGGKVELLGAKATTKQ
jgi:large subunit ribosomal protein L15